MHVIGVRVLTAVVTLAGIRPNAAIEDHLLDAVAARDRDGMIESLNEILCLDALIQSRRFSLFKARAKR
jgi:hypothetical protein